MTTVAVSMPQTGHAFRCGGHLFDGVCIFTVVANTATFLEVRTKGCLLEFRLFSKLFDAVSIKTTL
jgi:hypothetical protein